MFVMLFFYGYGDHRDLTVLTPPCPPRRSSDHGDPVHEIITDTETVSCQMPIFRFFLKGAFCRAHTHCQPGDPPCSRPSRSAFTTSRSRATPTGRSDEHTSELQSLMRITYAVFCLKKHTTDLHSLIRQSY